MPRLTLGMDGNWLLALHIVFLARKDDLLELDTRRRLFDHVRRFPGLHLSEIARGIDVELNLAKYHLTYLERHGLISSKRDEQYWRFWPKEEGSVGLRESVSVQEKQVLSFLRRPVPLHVTLLLLEKETATHAELLAHVGVSHGTLHYHLQKMERAGLLASERAGRERKYRLVDRANVLGQLLRYRPPDALVAGFLDAWESLELG